MKTLLLAVVGLIGLAVLLVAAHMAVIEVGREVITLRTQRADGTWQKTRLWIVDDGDSSWLHSAGDAWIARFQGNPVVEVERQGQVRRYRATPVPGPHPHIHELLRAKYGWADRWVRVLGPDDDKTVPVRLDPE